jgi:Alkylmercury lyase
MSGLTTKLSPDGVEDLRLLIYGELVRTGRAPTVAELASSIGWTEAQVRRGLDALHGHRDVVLGPRHDIVMAHPFSTVPLGFSVMGDATLWWGGCAWDSFAIPHLLELDSPVLIATRCPACHAPLAWNVGRHEPPSGREVAHFLTPADRIWDDIVRSCTHQRIFCSETCVDSWLENTAHRRGYVMDLATLWRLASGWYCGRLSHGYQRREPKAAATYFAEVGLHGPFWGLDR